VRQVYAKLESLGLSAGEIVTIHLCNSVGVPSNSIFSLDENITCGDSSLQIELLENEKIQFESYYELTLLNGLAFTFRVPVSENTKPHELTSLMKMGCYEGIVKNGVLDSRFKEKLNLFFTGEIPRFSSVEQSLADMYIFYADEVYEDGVATIDVVRKMDEYLAQEEIIDE